MPAKYPEGCHTTEEKLSFLEIEYDKLVDGYIKDQETIKKYLETINNWHQTYKISQEKVKLLQNLILTALTGRDNDF